MVEILFKSDNTAWGTRGLANDRELTFSGTFDNERIHKENRSEKLFIITTVLLCLVVIAGATGFFLTALKETPNNNYLFFLSHSTLNLLFWVSAFAALYLWARMATSTYHPTTVDILTTANNDEPLQSLDVYTVFNKEAKRAWNKSYEIASRQKTSVTSIHLFLALLETQSVQSVFMRLGNTISDIQTLLQNYNELQTLETDTTVIKTLPFIAFQESLQLHTTVIDPLMLLCGLVSKLPERHIILDILYNINTDVQELEIIASWIFNVARMRENVELFKKQSKFKSDDEINSGMTSVPTPFLDRFSQDMTSLAKHGRLPIALGRESDLSELFTLAGTERPNILIKGSEGTGRTTLLNELAYKMVLEQVPTSWQDKRLVKIDLAGIIAQPQNAEKTLLNSLLEATNAGNIIVVIEDLHALSNLQSSQGLSFIKLLVDFLESNPLTIIATTTLEEYISRLKPEANFDQTFTGFELPALTQTGIILACCIRATVLESQYKCFFLFHAIAEAVTLSDIYVTGGGQPQKSISILVEAAKKVQDLEKGARFITENIIQKVISEKTHIPGTSLSQDESEKLLNLEDELAKTVVGQTAAITAVAEGLRRARSGLVSKERPLASFLFLGPTGVGKTELAKTLAKNYFGEEKYLLRLDMSEYRGSDGIVKLLGSPGQKQGSTLVNHLKNYPFCLLLADEFEKASPEILNLFLQILEDGRLTTGVGETINLSHCMIIATSNAGTEQIQEGVQEHKSQDQIKSYLFNSVLQKFFPPELINRFDGVIVFNPLTQEEVTRVAFLQLQYLSAQLNEKGVRITFSDSVINDIATNAYDPLMGARPIRRYIQDHVEGFIAKLLLSKKLKRGSEYMIDLENNILVLK